MATSPAPNDALAPEGDVGLAHRAARGATWTATSAMLGQAAQLVSAVVLARLLTPEDYGLTTVVWVVVSFATLFTDLGIGASLVQKVDLDDDDVAAGFWANFATGVVLTVVVIGAAPLVARIYGEPELTGLIIIGAFSFTAACGVVPKALLERRLRFRTLAVVESIARITGWLAAIAFALAGFGASSLVLGPLVNFLLVTVLLWAVVRRRPRGFGTSDAYRRLWRYGSGLTGFNITNFLSHQSDSILVPMAAPVQSVGFYNRAYNLMTLPVDQVGGTMTRVLLPALATLQHDRTRIHRAIERALLMTCAAGFPAALGIGATADRLVPVMFGEQWEGAVPLIQVLAVASLPQIAATPLRSLYAALGETRRLFHYGLVQSGLSVAAVVAGLPWGVEGVVVALVIRHWIGIPLTMGPPLRLVGGTVGAISGALLGPTLASLLMAGVVRLTAVPLSSWRDVQALPVLVAVGAATYAALLRLLCPRVWEEGRTLLRRNRP